jgi:hypothetical protein
MPLDVLQTVEMIELLENFVDRLRPEDEEVRKMLDVGYTIENQSVYLEEIRPDWQNLNGYAITRSRRSPMLKKAIPGRFSGGELISNGIHINRCRPSSL